jgi:NhaP-type Na+/H+ or K+/H+ antiporter
MLGLGLLGLHDLGNLGLRWVLIDVIWATSASVAIGLLAGVGLGRLICSMQRQCEGHRMMHDFIGLGFVGLVYGVSELIHAWGFLAVFFAAMSLRQTELRSKGLLPSRGISLKSQGWSEAIDEVKPGLVSEGSLVFKEHLERLTGVILVILVGGSLFLDSWSWRAVSLALFLFFAARPLSVLATLMLSKTPRSIGTMTAWFGIRGIGSLYYLMYAIQHGLSEEQGLKLIHLTLIVVALSILVHGISVTPLMRTFRRRNVMIEDQV